MKKIMSVLFIWFRSIRYNTLRICRKTQFRSFKIWFKRILRQEWEVLIFWNIPSCQRCNNLDWSFVICFAVFSFFLLTMLIICWNKVINYEKWLKNADLNSSSPHSIVNLCEITFNELALILEYTIQTDFCVYALTFPSRRLLSTWFAIIRSVSFITQHFALLKFRKHFFFFYFLPPFQ